MPRASLQICNIAYESKRKEMQRQRRNMCFSRSRSKLGSNQGLNSIDYVLLLCVRLLHVDYREFVESRSPINQRSFLILIIAFRSAILPNSSQIDPRQASQIYYTHLTDSEQTPSILPLKTHNQLIDQKIGSFV